MTKELHLLGMSQSLVVFDVVYFVVDLPSRTAPQFADFVTSPFSSLFSHLIATFITARISGGSPFHHICHSRGFRFKFCVVL
ncbi:hypothetical protein HID58_029414 [Brassica napus]|uniref:Uncharacterized protein n=1 Tax=Brassica napus TaxID=3708 RepID=A0ABQ8CD37_BRANA|nr:hypothetical protein HID58_029414 [Brassica napus]